MGTNSNGYVKGDFCYRYPIDRIQKALDDIFNTKNDYSWNEYEKTLFLGLDLACRLALNDGEDSLLLNAAESATLGFYSKPKTKNKPKKSLTKE